jgi:beta-galactosidase
VKGTFSKLEKDGNNLLQEGGGPMLHLWRAPHQIDDMWAYRDWEKYGLKNMTWVTDEVKSIQVSPGLVDISVSLTGTGKQGFKVQHKATYSITGTGVINVVNNVSFSDPKLILARIGVRMFMKKEVDMEIVKAVLMLDTTPVVSPNN